MIVTPQACYKNNNRVKNSKPHYATIAGQGLSLNSTCYKNNNAIGQ